MVEEKSNVIDFQRYKINKEYYNIGLIMGALRAELENGTVALESVYGLLTDNVKSAIDSDLTCMRSAVKSTIYS